MIKKLLILSFLILFSFKSEATHIIGGEIYYDNLGSDNYKITLKVYRDCYNGIPPFDNPAALMIYRANGSLYLATNFNNPAITSVPGTINSPCVTPPTDVCVEQAIYSLNVNLPALTGGYYIVYQRCCRNNTILNLISPGGVGASYIEHIPGPEQVATNSCPRFNNLPPTYICNGYPIDFDHSANDPDGDSLVYSLCAPFTGLDGCCPLLGLSIAPNVGSAYCPVPPATCPVNGTAPPYSPVPFLAPYSGSYPLSSNPALGIHPTNGFLTGTPNINGQWVVGVCVTEYRNGIVIGTHYRDFQFNVKTCLGLAIASVPIQNSPCEGFNIQFSNNSIGANTYFWNFGNPSTLADTSNLASPSYTYSDTGKYTVTMIASVNGIAACSDTAQVVVTIYPTVAPIFVPPPGQCITTNNFSLNAGGSFLGNGSFFWNFGGAANMATSNIKDPFGIVFNSPGYFPITLTVSENGCTHSYTDSVLVYPVTIADFRSDSMVGCKPFTVQFSDNSLAGTLPSYIWNFGDGTTSTLSNPIHTYQDTGTYNVSLTVTTTSGCIGSSTMAMPGLITVKPSPSAGFSADPLITNVFNPIINFVDFSTGGISTNFITGDGNSYNSVQPIHYYEEYGDYWATQIITNSFGCSDTAKVKIRILPEYLFWIPNAFTPFNGDDLNGVFKPQSMGLKDYSFEIFDRWGNLIFHTTDVNMGWNGTFRGVNCEMDVYVYKIEYTDVLYDIPHYHKGRVTLIR